MAVYFELSWAILSTIGLVNVLFGLTVITITGVSPASLVPIVVSAAGSIANGLCYYAFYADYPAVNRTAASAIADLMWMVQEAGVSFYTYIILTRILHSRSRVIFISLFWTIIIAIFIVRMFILVTRARIVLSGGSSTASIINSLHVAYFTLIALMECVGASFLLRTFSSAKKIMTQASLTTNLFQHVMRSTEFRLTTLAFIGVSRAVTYFFQPSLQSATTTASQIDRFIYTIECLFPFMLFIDILASRLVQSNEFHDRQLHDQLVGPDTPRPILLEEVENSSKSDITTERRLRMGL